MGFLSDNMRKIKKEAGEDVDEKTINKAAILHEKVQNVVAPKMAEEALSQALNIKHVADPAQSISSQSIAQMKMNMRNKISQSAV